MLLFNNAPREGKNACMNELHANYLLLLVAKTPNITLTSFTDLTTINVMQFRQP